jgi:DnaJ-class molecular chaperone
MINLPNNFQIHNGKLFTQANITVWEALLGTNKDIQGPLNSIKLTVPENCQAIDILTIPESGLWNSKLSKYDDLYVRVNITVPKLTPKQKE